HVGSKVAQIAAARAWPSFSALSALRCRNSRWFAISVVLSSRTIRPSEWKMLRSRALCSPSLRMLPHSTAVVRLPAASTTPNPVICEPGSIPRMRTLSAAMSLRSSPHRRMRTGRPLLEVVRKLPETHWTPRWPHATAAYHSGRRARALARRSTIDGVYRALVGGERSFVQRFGERRVRVDGSLQILCGRLELHREHGLGDQLARDGTDDVHAEDVVVLAVRDQLHEADRLLHALRAAVHCERKRPDLVRPAVLLDLRLGLADPRDLGRRVDDGRNRLVVHLGHMARDELRDHHALFRALVREHRAAHDVADRPDVRHRRAAMRVDVDEAPLVELQRHVRRERTRGVRPAPDRDDERVELERLRRAAAFVADFDDVALHGRGRDLLAEPDIEALLLQMAQRFLRDLLIHHI